MERMNKDPFMLSPINARDRRFPLKVENHGHMLLLRGCNSAGVHSLSITTMVHPSRGIAPVRATPLARGYAQPEPSFGPDYEDLFII